MTAVLLDTHVLLWVLTDDRQIGPVTRRLLASSPAVHASAASTWELAIKAALGRVDLPDDVAEAISEAGLVELPISVQHALATRAVTDLTHKDPFDRLLVAQARTEGLVFVTADSAILTGASGNLQDARA